MHGLQQPQHRLSGCRPPACLTAILSLKSCSVQVWGWAGTARQIARGRIRAGVAPRQNAQDEVQARGNAERDRSQIRRKRL